MIKYKEGYRYQLAKNYRIMTPIKDHTISQGPIKLTVQGWLTIRKGYAWDGPTKAIHTKNFMRGSLVHDAFYQLMRYGRLDPELYREKADALLRDMCLQDGMWRLRAWWVYQFVSRFGGSAADPRNIKETLTAP